MLAILVFFSLVYFFLSNYPSAPIQYSMGGQYLATSPIPNLILSILKIILSFLPSLGLLLICLIFFCWLVGRLKLERINFGFLAKTSLLWQYLAIGVIFLGLVEYSYTNYFILDHIPHVPDAIAYTSQAKIFVQGKLFLPIDEKTENFPIVGLINFAGKRFSQYTFGHPLILSLGYQLGLPWLIPPIVGSLVLLLVYKICSEIYSYRVGFFATLLCFSSPFIKMNAASFMSHNSALLVALLCCLFLIKFFKTKKSYFGFYFGLSLGFLINIRPLTGVLIGLPMAIFIFINWLTQVKRLSDLLRQALPMLMGFSLMLLAYFSYNQILTGSWRTSAYDLGFLAHFGIDKVRTLAMALTDTYSNTILLNKVLLGWPLSLTFLFIFTYFFSRQKTRWEGLFLGIIFSLLGGYFFYQGSWMMYGPRFWYELAPFMIILIVLGIEKMPIFIKDLLFSKSKFKFETQPQLVLFFCYSGVMILLINNLNNWYFSKIPARWHQDFTPQNLSELKNFNYANSRLIDNISRLKLRSAVVFIKPGANWWDYGIPAYNMDLTFQDEIVYAADLGDVKNRQLMKFYPERSYYKADYSNATIYRYYLFDNRRI